ncbi:hypothetical protein OQA88_10232 [Cercophora sp. LCS_1]
MAPADADTAPPQHGRCSSCSKEATNKCSGCLDAPSYGGEVPQQTAYCSAACQKTHWSAHKAQCKILQTRRCIHRAALFLEAVVGIMGAKGEDAMVRLAAFMVELFKGLDVGIEEVALVNANEHFAGQPSMSCAYKMTTKTDEWVLYVDHPNPPTEWARLFDDGQTKQNTIHWLGFHRCMIGLRDKHLPLIELHIAALAEVHKGKLGWFLKSTKSVFEHEMNLLLSVMQETLGVMLQPHAIRGTSAPRSTSTTAPVSAQVSTTPNTDGISKADPRTPHRAEGALFKIKPLPGKGLAMIAASAIPKGTRILCEAPTLILPGNTATQSGIETLNKLITQQLTTLDCSTRERFFALHNKWGDEYPATIGIAKTNALPLGHAASEAGIFLDASRINHSCANNAENTWNPGLSKLTIHAIRDIPAGEEITISYVDGFKTYAQRQARLLASFGFRCACSRCSTSRTERKESDARRKRLKELEDEIGDGVGIVVTPLACLRKVREMVRLLEVEGMVGLIPRAYYDAFQVVIANGDQARARHFAVLLYDARVVVEGEDSADAVRAQGFVARPAEHRLYGTTMKWRQGVDKVPVGLSTEALKSWMWKEKSVGA